MKRRHANIAGTLALVVGSLALVTGALEIGLRTAGYRPIFEVYSKPSIFWRYDELLGWSHEPGASGIYVGPRPWPIEFKTPVHINSLGLRGPEIEDLPPGGRRILVLGDSVVAAFEVAYEHTFVALIEEALNRDAAAPVQVINAGVRGYGTDQTYLYYRERGRLLRPDLVIFFHSLNDLANNVTLHRMRRLFGKPAFALREDGSLELVGHPVPSYPLCSAHALDASFTPRRIDRPSHRVACWIQTRLADHSALFTFVSLRIRRNPTLLRALYNLGAPEDAAAAPAARQTLATLLPIRAGAGVEEAGSDARAALTTALLVQLAREVRASGADFVLVITPDEWQRLDPAALEAEGIEPTHLFYDPRLGALRFVNDSHFNARGHFVVAEVLEPLVRDWLAARDAVAETSRAPQRAHSAR